MSFHIGQKIVCIAPHPEWAERGCIVPRVGEIYTVRGIDELDGVLLEEIINENPFDYSIDMLTGQEVAAAEDSFWPHRFRPLVERRTDISIFQRILDKVNCRQRRTAQKQA
jgi:hypothetical protein